MKLTDRRKCPCCRETADIETKKLKSKVYPKKLWFKCPRCARRFDIKTREWIPCHNWVAANEMSESHKKIVAFLTRSPFYNG